MDIRERFIKKRGESKQMLLFSAGPWTVFAPTNSAFMNLPMKVILRMPMMIMMLIMFMKLMMSMKVIVRILMIS